MHVGSEAEALGKVYAKTREKYPQGEIHMTATLVAEWELQYLFTKLWKDTGENNE